MHYSARVSLCSVAVRPEQVTVNLSKLTLSLYSLLPMGSIKAHETHYMRTGQAIFPARWREVKVKINANA